MNLNRATQEALTTVTGNLPKAVICVRDIRDGNLSARDSAERAEKLQKDFMQKIKKRLKNPMTATFEDLVTIENSAMNFGYLPMRVQYNPSTIQIESAGGLLEQDIRMGLESAQNIQVIDVTPVATLSCQLVFDAVNNYDAFGVDNAQLNAGGALSTVAGAMGHHSVKKQCDGLLACMMSTATRQVIFYWTNMVFRGVLLSVNVNYQMFNRKGNPIRATVDLAIQQLIPTKKNEAGEFEPYWKEAFDRAFGAPSLGTDISGNTSKLDRATSNSLLNLNI